MPSGAPRAGLHSCCNMGVKVARLPDDQDTAAVACEGGCEVRVATFSMARNERSILSFREAPFVRPPIHSGSAQQSLAASRRRSCIYPESESMSWLFGPSASTTQFDELVGK